MNGIWNVIAKASALCAVMAVPVTASAAPRVDQDIVNSLQRSQSQAQGRQSRYAPSPEQGKILDHVKVRGGLPIAPATAEEAIVPNIPEDELPQLMKEKVLDPALKVATVNYTVPTKFPICPGPKTERLTNGKSSGAEMVLTDKLFIPDDRILNESETLFGSQTELMPISATTATLYTLTAQTAKVACLPTRFRMTTRGLVKLQGSDALKDYEHGGKIHPLIKDWMTKKGIK